jgi:hypothetical protein
MAGNLRARGPSVQTWAFPHLIAWLESQSLDTAPIRRLPGIVTTDPDRRVSESTAEAVWRLATRADQRRRQRSASCRVASAGALDLIEYAVRSSPTLTSGLERFARYGCLVNDRVAARAESNGHALQLIIRDVGTSVRNGTTDSREGVSGRGDADGRPRDRRTAGCSGCNALRPELSANDSSVSSVPTISFSPGRTPRRIRESFL